MTEILLPKIAREGTVGLISTRGQARKARSHQFELEEGFQPYHAPFRRPPAPGAQPSKPTREATCPKPMALAFFSLCQSFVFADCLLLAVWFICIVLVAAYLVWSRWPSGARPPAGTRGQGRT